ncbi:MAG: hypothetical protein WD052_07060 [Bacteroidales bacterium]
MKKESKTTRILIIALIMGIAGTTVIAQPYDKMAKYKEEKISFFNEKLELSKTESDLFWPVYEDLHNRSMKINEDERSLLNYYECNYKAMSKEEIDETINKFLDLQKKRNALTMQYHNTFVEVIGKKKTMRMYALEREFKMYILRKFRSGGGGGGKGGRGPYHDFH